MASKEALILAKPKPTVDSILPEIRLMIYYYILAEPIKLSVATDPSAEEYRPMIRRVCCTIVLVCRLFNHEVQL